MLLFDCGNCSRYNHVCIPIKPLCLVDAIAAGAALPIKASTIRKWKQRGKLSAFGKDAQGRVLYDLSALRQLAG